MKYIRSENGNTLLITIVVLVLSTVIALSLMSMSLNGLKRNETREDINQATEQAEKGITHITKLIQKQIEAKVPDPSIGLTNTKTNFDKDLKNILEQYYCESNKVVTDGETNPKYEVCLEKLSDQQLKNNPITLTFKSTGYADGKEQTIKSMFEIKSEVKNYPQVLNYAVTTHSEGNLVLNGGIDISGNILADGNVILSDYGYAPVIDTKNVFNPWVKSTVSKINGISKNPPIIKINNQKKLFIAKIKNFYGACKKYNSILPEIFTYNEFKNYNFNNINNTTNCLFEIKNPTQITNDLNYTNTPVIEQTLKHNAVNINEIINKGKNNLKTVIKGEYPDTTSLIAYTSHKATTPARVRNMLQVVPNVTLEGAFRIPSHITTSLTSSTLKGDFYFDGANLNLAAGSNNTLTGRYYFSEPKILESNLKIWGGKQKLDGEFYLEKTSKNANGIADGLDNAIEIINGTHEIKGIYYLNGDMEIRDSTIKANAVFYVNGDVQIKRSTIESLDGGKLIIFATGDIIYQFASELGNNSIFDYYNKDPLELNAFLFSNRKIELHGTISNIYLKGGVSAKQVFLSGVRGEVEKNLISFDFKSADKLDKNSRLRIEYDENVIKTIENITKNYSSTVTHTELIVQPLRQISRDIQ